MTAPAPKLPDRLLDAYRDAVAASTGASRAGVDELLRATTSTDNAYAALTGSVDSLTLGGLLAARADAATGLLDVKRLATMLARIKGHILHRPLDHVSPLGVSVMLEIGREAVYGESSDAILAEAEEQLWQEATA